MAISVSFGVDSNNFKTCEQSGFCNRLRKFKPEKSQYALNLDTVIVHGNVLSAEVNTVDTSTDKKIILVSINTRVCITCLMGNYKHTFLRLGLESCQAILGMS